MVGLSDSKELLQIGFDHPNLYLHNLEDCHHLYQEDKSASSFNILRISYETWSAITQ